MNVEQCTEASVTRLPQITKTFLQLPDKYKFYRKHLGFSKVCKVFLGQQWARWFLLRLAQFGLNNRNNLPEDRGRKEDVESGWLTAALRQDQTI